LLQLDINKTANVYVSGAVAIATDVLANYQMLAENFNQVLKDHYCS